MDWKLFVARRIYRSKEGEKEVSKPAVLIAMWGIAIGLAVMIVAVAVVIGFKHEVRDKVVGIGSDIAITNFDAQKSYETVPVVAGDSLLDALRSMEGVKHVQRYSTKPGMIMTEDNFLGMVLKGVSQEYDWTFLKKHLQVDSPYNTYKYAGLPPAPINVPPKACLEAVLSPENHKYLYFCASPDFDGTHRFAVTYSEHQKNARAFQRELTRRRSQK